MYERCWAIIEKEPRQIILPAFNDLVGGMAVNSDEFVNSVDAERTKIYLLDGTLLGYLSEIARAQHEA
jgi:metallophosphoesterase superfamily enzyme